MVTKAQHNRSYRPIPDLLRELREEAGLSQRQIGEQLDRPQSWVHNCEVGNRRVDLAEFVEWCRAVGIDPKAGLARFLKRS